MMILINFNLNFPYFIFSFMDTHTKAVEKEKEQERMRNSFFIILTILKHGIQILHIFYKGFFIHLIGRNIFFIFVFS